MEKNGDFSYPRFRRISNALLLAGSTIPEIGLFDGKSGIAIYFYYLSRYTRNKLYEYFAAELIDDVTEMLHTGMSDRFSDGIAGIGWSIAHLIRNNFIEAEPDEILVDLDAAIAESVDSDAFDSARWLGFALYYHSRLAWRSEEDNSQRTLGLRQKAREVILQLDRFMTEHVSERTSPKEIDFFWSFPWYLWVQSRLTKSGILNEHPALDEVLAARITLLLESDLLPENKWFLQFMAGKSGFLPITPIDYSPLLGLTFPCIRQGIAGAILLLSCFEGKTSESRGVIRILKERLKHYEGDPTELAGYFLSDSVRNDRKIGIESGLAGIGMAMII